MCVAAVIHRPVTLSYLRAMEKENPDGAGVAWLPPGATAVRFVRGLSAQEVWDLQESLVNPPYLLHFRWATQGAEVPEMTHPFPLGPRALMGELTGDASSVLIHNGTWSRERQLAALKNSLEASLMPIAVLEAASDTAIAAFLLPEQPALIDEIKWATCLAWADGGRLAMSFTGDWSELEGNQYSNLYWHPSERRSRYAGWSYSDYLPAFKVPAAPAPAPDKFDDYTDYLRARYGDEVADEVSAWADETSLEERLAAAEDRRERKEWDAFWALKEAEDADVTLLNEDDIDLVSEDPETVNAVLGRRVR